jgi:NADH-quinone oxidoreductase subunit E
VPDDALVAVAGLLGMSPDELDSVATFYNLIFRRPVGRHVILVCDTVSCWVMGYEAVVEGIGERLGIGFGETTVDGRFTLLPIPCLGACDRAPALMIDDDLHGPVEPGALDQILAPYA